MKIENDTLEIDDRDVLMTFAVDALSDYHYQDIMTNLSWFQEENRFYNWYNGFTVISLPIYENSISQKQKNLYFVIETFATSGKIWSANFGEALSEDNALENMQFNVAWNLPVDPAFKYEIPF